MHVLISGAGISGQVLAWFLAKAGIRCTILEREPSLLAQGQNIDLQGSAVIIAEKMGILNRIRERNTTEKGTQFVTADGKPFAQLLTSQIGSASPTSEFEILRGDLTSILYTATRDNPYIQYRFGTSVRKVLSNSDTTVEVELDNNQIEKYDLLVAADGQWSKIRSQCFPPEWVRPNDLGCFVAYWTMPRADTDNDLWNIYFGPDAKILSLRPDPYGTVRALTSFTPQEREHAKLWRKASRSSKEVQKELCQKGFANAGWEAERMLKGMQEAPDFYLQSVQQIRLSKWFVNRVVCVGDAAYAPTAMTGMGTTLAIDGAYILAGELSKTTDGRSIAQALETYDEQFRPFVEEEQQVPFVIPAILNANTRLRRWFICLSLWIFSRILVAIKTFARAPSQARESVEQDCSLPTYPAFD